jgi:hypothetical protein
MIPVPGYYRLVLDPAAVFEANFQALRLVKDGWQVPYFKGRSEIQAVKLPILASYDQAKNSSTWTVRLPRSSAPWEYLTLESQGVFERQVVLEIPGLAEKGWERWKEQNWKNIGMGPTVLQVGLHAFPAGVEKIRVRMIHGDNRPIELIGSNAFYRAPTLLFIAQKAGEYTLFGGHPDLGEAKYDLALLQAHLWGKMPQTSKMENWTPLGLSSSGNKIKALFEGRNWGLYAVLGLITLILVILIVRLFPKKGSVE